MMQWLQRVEQKDCTFEELSCSLCAKDYNTLDRKLALTVAGIVTGELKRSLAVKKEAFAMQGKLVAGRQILFEIDRILSAPPNIGSSVRYPRDLGEHMVV